MSDGPERSVVDSAATTPPELSLELQDIMAEMAEKVRKEYEHIPEDGSAEDTLKHSMAHKMAELFNPGGHIDPTPDQEFCAIDMLKSDWLGELVELEPDERILTLGEMAVNAAAGKDRFQLSVVRILLNSDEAMWGYISESVEQGPETRIWDTTHWLIANRLAELESAHKN
jgi:hypothetical protein